MGAWPIRRTRTPPSAARLLTDADLEQAAALCALDPVASVLAAGRIDQMLRSGQRHNPGEFWGYPAQGPLVAVCWSGANIVPVNPHRDERALSAFAEMALRRGRTASSMVGPAADVLGLWELLRGQWRRPRDVRAEQPSLAMSEPSVVAADPRVRLSTLSDFPLVLPACVAMFTEEIGYSPVLAAPQTYAERVRWLISQQRSLVRLSPPEPGRVPSSAATVEFKAELGALSPQVAQVQGVWVSPGRRRQGLAVPAMAAVVAAALRHRPIVSLYVNSYNTAALATYRAVGFERVGTYATVLF